MSATRRSTATFTLMLVVMAALIPSTAASSNTRFAARQIAGRAQALGACARDTENDPCPEKELFAIQVVLRETSGDAVARRKTKPNGRFSFRASPGPYSVEGKPVTGFDAPKPVRVVVAQDQQGPQRVILFFHSTTGPGVAGQVTQSPTCPGPQREGEVCTEPLEGARLRIEDETGTTVASTVTRADGYYEFTLDPGDYTLVAEGFEDSLPSPPPPIEFTVTADDTGPHWRRLDYDTGIR